MPLSERLVLHCFPDRKTINMNIQDGIDIWKSGPKVELLKDCRVHLAANRIADAAESAQKAGYLCMAQAILLISEGKIQ